MNFRTNTAFPRNDRLEKIVAKHYSSSLPYHNFHHVINTLSFGNDILHDCHKEDIELNQKVVYLGILFHDAGYSEDHTSLGFKTKESYSADLAESILSKERYSDSDIAAVKKAILSTEIDATFTTPEHQAVRAADLSGMAANYEIFLINSVKLKKEHELLRDCEISWENWKKVSIEVVKGFIATEIPLTKFFKKQGNRSAFEKAVRNNLERLSDERSQPEISIDF